MPETYYAPLSVSSWRIAKVNEVKYEKPILNTIPSEYYRDRFQVKNCTSVPQQTSAALSVSGSVSNTVTLTNTVNTTVSLNIGYTYGVPQYGSFQTTFNISRSVSFSKASTNTASSTYTRSENVNRTIPSGKRVWGELIVMKESISVPFTTTVVVDGSVDANLKGLTKLSEILSEQERTFTIVGTLNATEASNGIVEFYEEALTNKDCEGNAANSLVHSQQVQPLAEPTHRPDLLATFSPASDSMLLGSFATGMHTCQSPTDIGHTCSVVANPQNCDIAYNEMLANDCCPSTQLCTFNPDSGEVECRYGGSSIGFQVIACSPFFTPDPKARVRGEYITSDEYIPICDTIHSESAVESSNVSEEKR
ncbi:MAG: hypothetical protein AB2793_11375 [Candidatus Thiodiazotropha sp.]